MLAFNASIKEDKDYFYFGKYEVDDLVIKKETGRVFLKERGKNHILNSCADNSSTFLDAIFTAANYLAEIPLGIDVSSDPRVCAFSEQCSKLAGGIEHLNFIIKKYFFARKKYLSRNKSVVANAELMVFYHFFKVAICVLKRSKITNCDLRPL